jgi:hypothetical protein
VAKEKNFIAKGAGQVNNNYEIIVWGIAGKGGPHYGRYIE